MKLRRRARFPKRRCHARDCRLPRVGLSIWCRDHTDAILCGKTVSRPDAAGDAAATLALIEERAEWTG